MRAKRFFACVILTYAIGFSISTLLSYMVAVNGVQALFLLAFLGVIFTTTLGGWFYFRGVREASLRLCAQWAAVWMGIFIIADVLLLTLWLKGSVTDLPSTVLITYLMEYVGLLLVARITRPPVAVSPVEVRGASDEVTSPNLRLTI
jgi:uncharacterized protein (DUF2164 family)